MTDKIPWWANRVLYESNFEAEYFYSPCGAYYIIVKDYENYVTCPGEWELCSPFTEPRGNEEDITLDYIMEGKYPPVDTPSR